MSWLFSQVQVAAFLGDTNNRFLRILLGLLHGP